MKKYFYMFMAFSIAYLGIFSGSVLAALYVYYEDGYFSLTREDFLSPIKPAIIALIIQIFVAKLLPAKNSKSEDDS